MSRLRPTSFAIPLIIALSLVAATTPAKIPPAPSNAWSILKAPSDGSAQAIGQDAAGCLAGARALPLDGPGYAVVRTGRHRYFGHPELIDFIERLGRRAKDAGLAAFYVGDMAQPRGGPLPFGHASHQTGLDVDIWFTNRTSPHPGAAEREMPNLPSMLLPDHSGIDPARFGTNQVALLRLAAADPSVDRIFVSPVIKLALCRGSAGGAKDGTGWLQRLRPWWGHDDHFHVRLACPEDSPLCAPQKPVPEGDGCDAGLEDWARHPMAPPAHGPRQAPVLPAACRALLGN
jgi:penicillin-insensitive murein endopeptidase